MNPIKHLLPRSNFNAQLGFTLLEVLLAIGITALIGLGSWQILNSAIRTSEATQERLGELNGLQKAMFIMSRDFSQIITRSIRDGFGDYQPAVSTKEELYLVEFSRAGWRNPMDDERSDIQRVAYELAENKLLRHYWNVLDRSQDSEPVTRELLTDVNGLSIRFMNSSGGWTEEWPDDKQGSTGNNAGAATDPREKDNTLPKAIEITLDTKRFGKLKRLFALPVYIPNMEIQNTNGSNGGNGDDSSQNNTGGQSGPNFSGEG